MNFQGARLETEKGVRLLGPRTSRGRTSGRSRSMDGCGIYLAPGME
jgi:hypothetical protein